MADYARAERLRDLREETHLSREKVAGEIGVTTKTLYAWENGGSIRWENAKKLAAFYGVDPESLVTRELIEAANDEAPATIRDQLNRIERNQIDLADKLDVITALLHLPALQAAVEAAEAEADAPQTPEARRSRGQAAG